MKKQLSYLLYQALELRKPVVEGRYMTLLAYTVLVDACFSGVIINSTPFHSPSDPDGKNTNCHLG